MLTDGKQASKVWIYAIHTSMNAHTYTHKHTQKQISINPWLVEQNLMMFSYWGEMEKDRIYAITGHGWVLGAAGCVAWGLGGSSFIYTLTETISSTAKWKRNTLQTERQLGGAPSQDVKKAEMVRDKRGLWRLWECYQWNCNQNKAYWCYYPFVELLEVCLKPMRSNLCSAVWHWLNYWLLEHSERAEQRVIMWETYRSAAMFFRNPKMHFQAHSMTHWPPQQLVSPGQSSHHYVTGCR